MAASLSGRGPTGWRRMVVLFSLASFIEVIAYGQLAAFTLLYLPVIGVATADVPFWVGAISAGANLFGVAFLPFWGALADRLGRKPLIIRSFAATGLGLAVAAAAPNVWLFTIARGITALNLGNSGLMMTALAESAPARRIGFAYGVLNGAGPLGAFLGPLAGGPFVDRLGFAVVLGADAILLGAVVLVLTIAFREAFSQPSDPPSLLRSAFGGVALLVRSSRLRLLFPALLVGFAGWMLVFTYTPLAVARIHEGTDPATAIGLVLGAGGLATLVASPLSGAIADRFGLARTYFSLGTVAALLWLGPWMARDYVSFLIAWALANGVGSGLFSLSFNVLARSVSDVARARVMTFSYLPLNVGFILGPAIGTVIASTDPFAIFPTAVVLELAGLALVALALRQRMA